MNTTTPLATSFRGSACTGSPAVMQPESPPTPLVLLVCRSASRSQLYRAVMDRKGVACLMVTSLKEVNALAAGTAFSGLLLDMPVMVKATPSERLALEDLQRALPCAYLNIAPASDSIKLMMVNDLQGTAATIEEFAELSTRFPARCVAPKDRITLHLHTLLQSAAATSPPEQTVTLDLSPGGCFLFSVDPSLQTGAQLSLQFIGLNDPAPINAAVCWRNPFGTPGKPGPGVGAKFVQISPAQREQLMELLQQASHEP